MSRKSKEAVPRDLEITDLAALPESESKLFQVVSAPQEARFAWFSRKPQSGRADVKECIGKFERPALACCDGCIVPGPGSSDSPIGSDFPKCSRKPAQFRMPNFTASSAPRVDLDAAQGANLGKEFPSMRSLARSSLALCALALVTSAAVRADDAPAMPGNPAAPQNSQVSGHHHQGLFGWRHCVECQRAMAKKRDGVDVPPPPMTAAGAAMGGTVVHEHIQGAPCAACQAGTPTPRTPR